MEGQIYQLLSGFYLIHAANNQQYTAKARGKFRKNKVKPMVGDFVDFSVDENDEGYILDIQPRKNYLIRPSVSNVDQAVVVTAVVEPDLSLNLLDRQLVTLTAKNIKPIIYFSKLDLVNNQETYDKLMTLAQNYQIIGYTVVLNDSEQLRKEFKNCLTVFMGQTGAGKSTLLNKLDPALQITTNQISNTLNRGKHTTRKVSLYSIEDGLIADTPGFSSYDDFNVASKELYKCFPEFKQLSQNCKYRECQHINEPHCAVKEALEQQKIMDSRYKNYLQFYQQIKQSEHQY